MDKLYHVVVVMIYSLDLVYIIVSAQFCHRLLMAEFNLDDWDSASLVFQLMDKDTEFNVCLKVARNCRTMEEAEKFMNQECPVCMDEFLMDEVSCTLLVTLAHCTCMEI